MDAFTPEIAVHAAVVAATPAVTAASLKPAPVHLGISITSIPSLVERVRNGLRLPLRSRRYPNHVPTDSLARSATFAALALFTLSYIAVWVRSLLAVGPQRPSLPSLLTGFVTNFFDTLGIGSFATTTSIFKFTRMVPDHLIPGTLNAGHTIPTILQAFIYIAAIEVDLTTLLLMIGGAVAGSWFGAGWVANLPRRKVQFGVGGALLFAFLVLLMRQFDLFPAGGDALGLSGSKLFIAVALNTVFAAISTLGIGFYAPCMTLVGLLGMNPVAAFPIMMGSSAFLMPVASARFVLSRAYSPAVALGLTVGGLLGVPLAAFVVKSLPLTAARWLVMFVILYAAVRMLRSAYTENRTA